MPESSETAASKIGSPAVIGGNDWNERIVAEFRANGGYVPWSSEEEFAAGRPVPPRMPGFDERGMPLILLHTIGAKSGRERINPLFFLPVGDDWAVFGTHGGSPRHPVWYHNLMANPRVTVEVGTERVSAVARLVQGAERKRIWAKETALVPKFAEFEAAAGRQIPVFLLERAHERAAETTMTTRTESSSVRELLDRAAITELIHTLARALDARDWNLLATCYAPEAVADFMHVEFDDREAIIAGTKEFLEPLDATQHLVGNIQITIEADTATTHATFMAQHVRAEATGRGQYVIGGNYDDSLRRTDDGWKITRRQIRRIWSNGDPSVLIAPVS